MSKKTKTIVHSAEKNEPDPEPKALAVSPQNVQPEQPKEVAAETILDVFKNIDPAKVEMAEGMGIPIRKLIAWTVSVEERFKLLEETLPAKLAEAMQKKQQEIAQMSPPQRQGGSGGFNLADGIRLAQETGLLGGGVSNEINETIMKQVMDAGLKSMTLTSRLGEAVLSKYVEASAKSEAQKIVEGK